MQRRVFVAAAVVSVLAAAPAFARPKVVVLNLGVSDPSLKQLADTLSEQVLTELGKTGKVDAMGQSDMSSVLGLEREKQMLGCSEQAACFAELSAAMGAPWIVTGTVARLGKALRVDLKLIRSRDGAAAFRDGRDTTDESAVFGTLAAMVREMVAKVDFETGAVSARAVAAGDGPGVAPWLVVACGGVVAVAGGALSAIAAGDWGNLNDPAWRAKTPWSQVQRRGDAFNQNVVLGPSLVAAGVALAAGGLVWNAMGRSDGPKVSVVPTANGFVIGGAL